VLHGGLERAADFLNRGAALQLDHRLLDVGIDAPEHAREQVALEQRIAGQRVGGRHGGPL
jgi:hypothetical protein